MSQPPKRRPPQQNAARRSAPPPESYDYEQDEADYGYEDDGYETDQRSAPPRNRAGSYSQDTRRMSSAQRPRSSNQGRARYDQQRYQAPPKRDMFPVLMGGLIGAMVIGIGLIIILLLNNNSTNSPGTGPVASATPPRLPIDEFKKLYDNTATRPMVIDVRSAEAYAEGHIKGAVNLPEANIDSVVAQIPKDKLVVAYCQ